VDQNIFFRFQSDIKTKPHTTHSIKNLLNTSNNSKVLARQSTAGFDRSSEEEVEVSEGPENSFSNLVKRTYSFNPVLRSCETPVFT